MSKSRNLWQRPAALVIACVGVVLLFVSLAVYFPANFFDDLVVTVEAPAEGLTNQPMSVAVTVRSRSTGRAIPGAKIECSYLGTGKRVTNAVGTTDEYGVCNLTIVPTQYDNIDTTAYCVSVLVRGMKGAVAKEVKLKGGGPSCRPKALFLLTDKPLYQPGQTVHYSAFVLTPEDHRP